MMKKLICWLLVLGLMLTAAGCKKNNEPETIPTESTTEVTEPEVLEIPYETEEDSRPYLGVVLKFQSALTASDAEAVAIRKAAEFFETTTGAVVNIHWKDGTMDVTRMDIFEVDGALLASDYIDYALDLGDMAQAANYESWSYGAMRQQVVNRCGYLAGIASVPHLTALYYDVDAMESCVVETLPATWLDFLVLCKNLVQWGWTPLTMDAESLTYQIYLCIPAITAFTIAVSVALRRKGFTKSGLLVQLVCPALFFVHIFVEALNYYLF